MLQAMQVQNMVWAPAVITVLTALANVPINMLLIAWYDFWGAALATSVARILQLALLCGTSPTVCCVLVKACFAEPAGHAIVATAILLYCCAARCKIFASRGTGCVGLCHLSTC